MRRDEARSHATAARPSRHGLYDGHQRAMLQGRATQIAVRSRALMRLCKLSAAKGVKQ